MSVQWITYKGKQILYSDYSGLKDSAYIDAVKSSGDMLNSAPGRSLVLVNVTGAVVDTAAAMYAKSLGKTLEQKTEKLALVGVTGMKELLLEAYNQFTGAANQEKLFQSVDEAKEWLVE